MKFEEGKAVNIEQTSEGRDCWCVYISSTLEYLCVCKRIKYYFMMPIKYLFIVKSSQIESF